MAELTKSAWHCIVVVHRIMMLMITIGNITIIIITLADLCCCMFRRLHPTAIQSSKVQITEPIQITTTPSSIIIIITCIAITTV